MKEHPLAGGGALEARSVGDAAVDVRTPFEPDRVEHPRDGAGGMDRGREQPAVEHAHAAPDDVEDRRERGHVTAVEARRPEGALEQGAEPASVKQARARARVPEVGAPQGEERVGDLAAAPPRGPEPGHKRARARTSDARGKQRVLLEDGEHPRVGEEAEEAGGHREAKRRFGEPRAEGRSLGRHAR